MPEHDAQAEAEASRGYLSGLLTSMILIGALFSLTVWIGQ